MTADRCRLYSSDVAWQPACGKAGCKLFSVVLGARWGNEQHDQRVVEK
jgi:hypothetical protein